MIVLGIDPGLATVGLALVERSADGKRIIVTTSLVSKPDLTPMHERIIRLTSGVFGWAYKGPKPDMLAIERYVPWKGQARNIEAINWLIGSLISVGVAYIPHIALLTSKEVKDILGAKGGKEGAWEKLAGISGWPVHDTKGHQKDACAVALTAPPPSGIKP